MKSMEKKVLLTNRPLSLIIMDFDGVIIDSECVWYEVFKEWFWDKLNYYLSEKEFLMVVGSDSKMFFERLKKTKKLEINIDLFKRETKKSFVRRSKELPLIFGVEQFLKHMKSRGIRLCIATSSKKEKLNYHLVRLGLTDYFDFVVTAESVKNIKPEPDLFLKAIEIAGVKREEAVIIEDSRNGLIAGKRAGIDVIVCPNEVTKSDDFSDALTVVDSLDLVIV